MSPPRKEHPRGKPRPWEPPPPEPVPVPDHTPILFYYLHIQGRPPDTLQLAAYLNFIEDFRQWLWDKTGGLTFYHYRVEVTDRWDNGRWENGELVYDPMTLDDTDPDYYGWRALNKAGDHFRATGEAAMALFDARPHCGGCVGAHLGHARHGHWAVDAMNNLPQPQEVTDSGWGDKPWPGLSLGGFGHEFTHILEQILHVAGRNIMGEHYYWPDVAVADSTLELLKASTWLRYGPRPETGNWRRWL